jgi:hypothetical protein
MSFTLGDFRRLNVIRSSYNALAVVKDLFWSAWLMFVISDDPVTQPHQWLQDSSHGHVAFLNYGPRSVRIEYQIRSTHGAIGFCLNDDKPEWEGFERVKTIDPLYPAPDDVFISNNCSRLISLAAAAELKVESIEGECSVSPDPAKITPQILPLDVSILLNKSTVIDRKETMVMDTYNFFVSHASEDKDAVARPLAMMLDAKGWKVWFDEFELKMGDSILASIDRGLASSEYGIVVLSPIYFDKFWTQEELDGLTAIRAQFGNKLLPVLHNMTVEELSQRSPMLAGKVAISTNRGLDAVVEEILRAIN